MSRVRSLVGALRRAVGGRPPAYQPDRYWEGRASELIATYNDPAIWQERRWNITKSPEQDLVPRLITGYGIESVLVVGAGSGRQYAYLEPLDIQVRGFDLSPTLVRECTARYPAIVTVQDTVTGCDARQAPADLILAVTVLQHVPPTDIRRAIDSLLSLAGKLVVILEFTRFEGRSHYIFAHDYVDLMGEWPLVESIVVAEDEHERTECLVWLRPNQNPR